MTPPGYPIPPRRYAEPGRAELGPASGVPSAVRNLGRVEERRRGRRTTEAASWLRPLGARAFRTTGRG